MLFPFPNGQTAGRERIDLCPEWDSQDTDETAAPAAPFTVVFGGNGAGKSAVFDAALFVLGQVRFQLKGHF